MTGVPVRAQWWRRRPADKEAAAYDFDADRRPALISSGPPTSSSVAGGRRDEASRPRRGSGWWNLPRR